MAFVWFVRGSDPVESSLILAKDVFKSPFVDAL